MSRHARSLAIGAVGYRSARNVALYSLMILGLYAARSCAETSEGFAEPYQQIEITGATEPGLITEILVKEGDLVRPGDVLATLESGVLEASLKIAERRSQFHGRLQAAVAEFRLRRDRLQKLELLRQEGHASVAELERAATDMAVAEAQVKLAEEEMELAELEVQRIRAQIRQRMFFSPIDGVVSRIDREVGESILLTDPALMTLVQLHPLKVRFPVSVSAANRIHQGDQLPIEIPDISLTVMGRVELVSPVVDAKSSTVQLTCRIDNETGSLRSGMRCLLKSPSEPQPLIPTKSEL